MSKFLTIPGISGYSVENEPGEIVHTRCGYCGTPYFYVVPERGQVVKTTCPKVAQKGEKQCNTIWIYYTAKESFAERVARERGLPGVPKEWYKEN